MRINLKSIFAILLLACRAFGTPLTASDFLEGEGAVLERMTCSLGSIGQGVPIFMDRVFVFHEPPQGLRDMPFLKFPINGGRTVRIARNGLITAITPAPDIPGASCSNAPELEALGFIWIQAPAVFQLFGESKVDQCRIYQKRVKAGEAFEFKKWAVIAGFNLEGLDFYLPNARVARVVEMLKNDTARIDALLNAQDILVNRPEYVVFIPKQPRDKQNAIPLNLAIPTTTIFR